MDYPHEVVIDTRQKYFHVSTDFLENGLLPTVVYVYHPAYRKDDKGIASLLYAHGYISTEISPILDQYRQRLQKVELSPLTVHDTCENYKKHDPPHLLKINLKKLGDPFQKLWQNLKWRIGIFVALVIGVCLAVGLIYKWLTAQKITVQTIPAPAPVPAPAPAPTG